MNKQLEKIFDRDIDCVNVALTDIELYLQDEIEEIQNEYRILKRTGEPNPKWFGENYYVIGLDTACEDPIIVNIEEEKMPVYYMMKNVWSSLEIISDSFENFIKILHLIEEIDWSNSEKMEDILREINKISPSVDTDKYWRVLLKTGFDFMQSDN